MDKVSKVCHIVYSFESIGGLENGLINIVNNSRADEFHHVVCSLTSVGDLSTRISNPKVTYYGLGKKQGNDLSLPGKIYQVLRKERPDVVHLRNWPTMVEGFLAAKTAGVGKVVYSEHGRHFESVWQRQHLKTEVIRFVLNRVDHCLCVSGDVADEMKSLYRLKRPVEVILNGVDTHKFRPFPVDDLKLKSGWSGKPVVGSVGRLDRGKRYHDLITHFAELVRGANLVIAGDGPESGYLHDLVQQLDRHGGIFLTGLRNDIPELLNCLDIFALPSESEGLSNAVMEAMSCGLPIVACDVGGNRELVADGKGGFLVQVDDHVGFMEKILLILQNRELAEAMKAYNRKLIVERFSITSMVEKYHALYRDR